MRYLFWRRARPALRRSAFWSLLVLVMLGHGALAPARAGNRGRGRIQQRSAASTALRTPRAPRMPAGAFLLTPVHSAAELSRALQRPEVIRRYARAFDAPPATVRQRLSVLRVKRLAASHVLRVYYYRSDRRWGYRLRRVGKGTAVFVSREGEPRLVRVCGNLLRRPPGRTPPLARIPPFTPTEPDRPVIPDVPVPLPPAGPPAAGPGIVPECDSTAPAPAEQALASRMNLPAETATPPPGSGVPPGGVGGPDADSPFTFPPLPPLGGFSGGSGPPGFQPPGFQPPGSSPPGGDNGPPGGDNGPPGGDNGPPGGNNGPPGGDNGPPGGDHGPPGGRDTPAVPEPASILLLGAGLLPLGLKLRRRPKAAPIASPPTGQPR
jgi:hypothetical protein